MRCIAQKRRNLRGFGLIASACLLLICLCFLAAGAKADYGDCGANHWSFEDGVLTISGNYAMNDYSSWNTEPGYGTHRSDTQKLVIEEGIPSIGSNSFYEFSSLTEVVLPSSLTSIHEYAFTACKSLKTITIPSGVTDIRMPFYYTGTSAVSSSLVSIDVADSNPSYVSVDGILYTKDMKTLVFCPPANSLTSFTVPSTVEEIGTYAFYKHNTIQSVKLPSGLKIIGEAAFMNSPLKSAAIPSSVTAVRASAFRESKIVTVSIPGGVGNWDYGNKVFFDCWSLVSAVIQEGVTDIPDSAFTYCYNMKILYLPKSLTTVKSMAFDSCENLDVYYAGSEEEFDNINFGTNSNPRYLKNCTLHFNATPQDFVTPTPEPDPTPTPTPEPDPTPTAEPDPTPTPEPDPTPAPEPDPTPAPDPDTTPAPDPDVTPAPTEEGNWTDEITVKNGIYKLNTDGTAEFVQLANSSVTSLTIPATVKANGQTYKVTSIRGWSCFMEDGLKKVTIGANVKTIGEFAFFTCTSLKTVSGGKGLVSIGQSAFGYSALKKFTFYSNMKEIGQEAFIGCGNLKTIVVKTKKLTSGNIGKKAFSGIHSKVTVTCPSGKKNAYKKIFLKKGMKKTAKFK